MGEADWREEEEDVGEQASSKAVNGLRAALDISGLIENK